MGDINSGKGPEGNGKVQMQETRVRREGDVAGWLWSGGNAGLRVGIPHHLVNILFPMVLFKPEDRKYKQVLRVSKAYKR